MGFTGNRCEKIDPAHEGETEKVSESNSDSNSGSVVTGLLIFFGLLVLVLSGLAVGYVTLKRRRSGKPFTHERLDDNNLEISNPMYMNGDIEDEGDPMDREFTLDPDKVNIYFISFNSPVTMEVSRIPHT